MSEQNNGQVSTFQRPTTNDPDAWKTFWKEQGQPWRNEPEIDTEQQKYLAERRAIVPDIEKGIYPFKDIKLSRADVEWLLATHENGRGPVDWSDEKQRKREGLDLRGIVLVGVNLSDLPLACLIGGITAMKPFNTTPEQRSIAAIHLEGANLINAHLERAILSRARFEGANLRWAHLEEARLFFAHLEGTDLRAVHLEGAYLYHAYLNGKDLKEEELNRLYQWKPDFPSRLAPANLKFAFFDRATNLDSVILGEKKHGYVSIAYVRWGDADLEMVNWVGLEMSGDEYIARQKKTPDGKKKDRRIKLVEYRRATRANRQLSNELRSQGLTEEANYFSYRSQILHRKYLWQQIVQQQVKSKPPSEETEVLQIRFRNRVQRFVSYISSWFLFLLAGYGYRPGRSVIWYLVTIFGFALAYFAIGRLPFFPDAFVFSLTSFHGRGFFPGLGSENSLHNPLVIMAAFEAVVGLLIEISFIATFTQRFFGR